MDTIDKEFLKKEENPFPVNIMKSFIVTASLALLNVLSSVFIFVRTGFLDAEPALVNSASTILIFLPIVSFVLGVVAALIPYKELNYGKRYLPYVLLIYFILNCIVILGLIIGLIRSFYLVFQ